MLTEQLTFTDNVTHYLPDSPTFARLIFDPSYPLTVMEGFGADLFHPICVMRDVLVHYVGNIVARRIVEPE